KCLGDIRFSLRFNRVRQGRRQNKKTRRAGRVFVDTDETRATAYPAGVKDGSGRRAREVMPAAMRALVRFAGERLWRCMTGKVAGISMRCNKSRDWRLGIRDREEPAFTNPESRIPNLGFTPLARRSRARACARRDRSRAAT